MPKSGKELIKIAKKNGWVVDRVRGSHHVLVKGNETVTIPVHGNKDLAIGTEKAILKKIGGRK